MRPGSLSSPKFSGISDLGITYGRQGKCDPKTPPRTRDRLRAGSVQENSVSSRKARYHCIVGMANWAGACSSVDQRAVTVFMRV
jgi:hypothetical protein